MRQCGCGNPVGGGAVHASSAVVGSAVAGHDVVALVLLLNLFLCEW